MSKDRPRVTDRGHQGARCGAWSAVVFFSWVDDKKGPISCAQIPMLGIFDITEEVV